MKYDRVYYWSGGEEVGLWHEIVCPGDAIATTIAEIERGGRVAYRGKASIGPPEGPPSKHEVDRVLRYPTLPNLR